MPYECDICGRTFKNNQGLGSHLRSHRNVKIPTPNPQPNESILDLDSEATFEEFENPNQVEIEKEKLNRAKEISEQAQPVKLANLDSQNQPTSRFGPYKNVSELKFAKAVRNAGLRRPQAQVILNLLRDDDFQVSEIQHITPQRLEEIERSIPNREKFHQHEFEIDRVKYHFFCRDIVKVALELFEDPTFADGTSFKFELKLNQDGERVFEEFHHGEWFEEAQSFLGGRTVPIAIILHVDEKRVAVKNGLKMYPASISLGNHSFFWRQKKISKRVVGYIPIPQGQWKKNRRHTLQIHQFCMRTLIKPLKNQVGSWTEARDPNGDIRRVCVLLATIVCDWEEGAKISLVLKMPSDRPCHTCFCLLKDFSSFVSSKAAAFRDAKKCTEIFRTPPNRLREWKSKKKQFCKDQSLVPIKNCFWDLPCFDVFRCMGPDCLHVLDIGLFQHILQFIFLEFETIYEELAETMKKELDVRFSQIPPFPKLILFPHGISKVEIEKKGKFQGREFRSIMKQILVALVGITMSETIVAVKKFLTMYKLAKLPAHSPKTLQKLDLAVEECFDALSVFKRYSPSRLNFPKFHVPAHFTYFIRKFGRLQNLDTETFEQFLHFAAQEPYDHSNKKQSHLQQASHFIELQDNREYLNRIPEVKNMEEEEGFESDTTSEFSDDEQPKKRSPPKNPRVLNKGKNVEREDVLNQLRAFIQPSPALLNRIFGNELKVRVYVSARLSSGQRINAGRYHDKEIYSCVDLQNEGGMSYARVLLIFSNHGSVDQALVQLFKPDTDPRHPHIALAGLSPLKLSKTLKVVPLEKIEEVVHIVPDFSAPAGNNQLFLLNPFVNVNWS